ncbi:MAG: cation:proton antiporter [Spirochaetes bacterium]|nr:MAG: cation:proton antiporter [Spirochaetota bacterium]
MDALTKWKIVRILLTTIYLMFGWILFSGTFTLTSITLGLVFSSTVAFFTYSLFIEKGEAARRSLLPRVYLVGVYFLLLVFKMYVASFEVLLSVLRGRINPRVVHFRTRLKSDIARVLLANSITMTPGTVTLNLDDDHLIVHWLNAKTTHSRYAGNIIKGDFEEILKRIWI